MKQLMDTFTAEGALEKKKIIEASNLKQNFEI
jgi:hypothetical protein